MVIKDKKAEHRRHLAKNLKQFRNSYDLDHDATQKIQHFNFFFYPAEYIYFAYSLYTLSLGFKHSLISAISGLKIEKIQNPRPAIQVSL